MVKVITWGLFIAVLSLGLVLVEVATRLKEIGDRLHRIALWLEDNYGEKRRIE